MHDKQRSNVRQTGAIAIRSLNSVWKIECERQMFHAVKKEALRKHKREDAIKAHEAA